MQALSILPLNVIFVLDELEITSFVLTPPGAKKQPYNVDAPEAKKRGTANEKITIAAA